VIRVGEYWHIKCITVAEVCTLPGELREGGKMGVAPAREEVQNTHEEIDRTLTMIAGRSHLLERILGRMRDLGLNPKDLATVRTNLAEVRKAVTIVKNRVRSARSG
jgi:hypothetical protein